MNAIGGKPRRKNTSTSKKDKKNDAGAVRIILTQVEKELLLKACVKYRYTIPTYIKSKQPEVDALDAIIGKLS